MAVTLTDVRHVAALARVALNDDEAVSLVGELNSILRHIDVLAHVNTNGIEEIAGAAAAGVPLRTDLPPAIRNDCVAEKFAPLMRDGFFLVPRLSTHEDADASS